MPIKWSLDAQSRVVQFVWEDPYTFDEWRLAMSDVLKHPSYRPGYRFLVDRREATAPPSAFIAHLTDFLESHRTEVQGARAALIARDDAGFGMARMTELATMGRIPSIAVRVFRDPAEAEGWLNS